MGKLNYVKFEKVPLKNHAEYKETWLQDRIADDHGGGH